MSKRLTPNQLVAANLTRIRKQRGLTQRETAARLAPFLARTWSVASLSAAERSVDGKRVKQFDADDLVALSRMFEIPLGYWFQPQEGETVVSGRDHELSEEELLHVVFGEENGHGDQLLGSLLPSSVGDLDAARRVLNLLVPILQRLGQPSLSGAGDTTDHETELAEITRHQLREGGTG